MHSRQPGASGHLRRAGGLTAPFLSVQGKPEQRALARHAEVSRPTALSFPHALAAPSCPSPTPIPSRVSPWASPFTKINRFFRLKARHLFGKAPRDGTVGPILTLDF